jgi:hypothetical protein
MVMLRMDTVFPGPGLRLKSRQGDEPGIVTWTVTAVPLPAVLEPSIINDLPEMFNSEAMEIVSFPAERLNTTVSPSDVSAMACRRVPGPESELLITVTVAALRNGDAVKQSIESSMKKNFGHLKRLQLDRIGNCILDRITGFTGLKCKENGNRVPLLQEIQAVATSLLTCSDY